MSTPSISPRTGMPVYGRVRGDDDGAETKTSVARLAEVYALRGLPQQVAHRWAELPCTEEEQAWLIGFCLELHRCGLDAEQALRLYRFTDRATRVDVTRLIKAGRAGGIGVEWLHWWATSGLLRRAEAVTHNGRRNVAGPYTPWVTQARAFIAALDGDQKFAALSAAAGLEPDEAAAMRADGRLVEDQLVVLAGLRRSTSTEVGA